MQPDAIIITDSVRTQLMRRAAFLASDPAADTKEAEDAFAPDATQVTLPVTGPRAALAAQFGVTAAEMALLDLCVAIRVDPALETLVADCQGKPWRPAPTEALVRRLAGLPPGAIWRATGTLARWRLVTRLPESSGAAPSFVADDSVVDWYFGRAVLSDGLIDRCAISDIDQPLPNWDIDASRRVLSELLSAGTAVRVALAGSVDSGREMMAMSLCKTLEVKPLLVQGAALNGAVEDHVARLHRFAALSGRALIWQSLPAQMPVFRAPVPLQFLLTSDTVNGADHAAFDYVIPQPIFTPDMRAEFWQALAPGRPLPMALHNAAPDELRRLAPMARKGGDTVEVFLRHRALSDLDAIGHVKRPELGWDDIILPPSAIAALKDYAFEARSQAGLMGRPEVRRLYAADAAPTALFTGPPGVGKTMAAECIARELDLPLLVIDVSRTVSKYIGETAKNLTALMERARRFGCILFFDEADAFFAKRTELKDSNDRHANADTNHLLQLIESYEGQVILSTNKPANIDEAFFRRIRHIIDFHRPDTLQRRALWAHYVGVLAGQGALNGLAPTFDLCAERFELTPAQIKNATLTAHFVALRETVALGQVEILGGIARELQKDGRSLPSDLAAFVAAERRAAHVA
ncbi:MAG: ATP-binding protein [Sulfitobacter sp.]